MPLHAGRLRPLERCVFLLVFALMAGFVVVAAVLGTRPGGPLQLSPSVGQRGDPAGLGTQHVQAPYLHQRASSTSRSPKGAGQVGTGILGPLPSGAMVERLDAQLADALQPVLGGDPGRLAVGVVDMNTGATATFDAGVPIRGGGVVAADILAALLLRHQQAGTPVTASEAGLATDMIRNGSGAAAAQLWTVIGGGPGMNAANATLKLYGTTLAPGADWTRTKTTVVDQLQLLADLTGPVSPLNAATRGYALNLMTDVPASQRWGVLAAASAGSHSAVADGSLAGPMWVIGSIGVIYRNGHELLLAVLSDHNVAQQPAVMAAQAAVLAAARIVS